MVIIIIIVWMLNYDHCRSVMRSLSCEHIQAHARFVVLSTHACCRLRKF